MIRRVRTLLLLSLAGCGLAHAEGSGVLTGSVGVTSDFVYRGLSLTRGKPTAQASLDVEFASQLYVGGFIAGADPNPGPGPAVEFDVWAGKFWRITDDVSVDLRLSQYTYPDDPRRVNYDRTEITSTVGWRNRLFAAANYSPNTRALGSSPGTHGGKDAWALEVSARQPLSTRYALSAGVGHYVLRDVYDDGYTYWNLTLTGSFAPFEVQLAWLGSDGMDYVFSGDSTGDRVAVTALWRFSTAR